MRRATCQPATSSTATTPQMAAISTSSPTSATNNSRSASQRQAQPADPRHRGEGVLRRALRKLTCGPAVILPILVVRSQSHRLVDPAESSSRMALPAQANHLGQGPTNPARRGQRPYRRARHRVHPKTRQTPRGPCQQMVGCGSGVMPHCASWFNPARWVTARGPYLLGRGLKRGSGWPMRNAAMPGQQITR